MMRNVQKGGSEKFPVFVRLCVFMYVCRGSKKSITCNPRTVRAIGLKVGMLEELFHSDKFAWVWFCP